MGWGKNCIIHQLRNSGKYVSYKDIKKLMADLKVVYTATDEQSALSALEEFEENWANLSTYFKFPQEVLRLDLYGERDWGLQPSASEGHQIKIGVSDR